MDPNLQNPNLQNFNGQAPNGVPYPQQPMQPQMQQPQVMQPQTQPQYQPQPQLQPQPQFQPQPQPQPQNMAQPQMVPEVPKKSKKGLIIILIAAVVLTILGAILFLTLNSGPKTRVAMIYMAGSDLESKSGLASAELDRLDYNSVDPNTKIVLIAGGTSRWNNDYIDEDETSIYELTAAGFTKVKQQSLLNMGEADTLSSFLNYVYTSYPADAYDLIFWNHGGAIDGSEYDEQFLYDQLTLTELDTAFASSPFATQKLELLIYRTCLNGTIEVASTVDNYANYLVASEEITYGNIYSDNLGFLNEARITDSAIDIGKAFIEGYRQQMAAIKEAISYSTSENSIYSTYALIDLSKISNLTLAVNDLFNSIDPANTYNSVSRARANAMQYGGSDGTDYDMVDMYNFVELLSANIPGSSAKCQEVLSLINESIVFNWATDSSSRGLSIYFPYYGESRIRDAFLSIYETIDDLREYGTFIANFNDLRSSTKTSSYSYVSTAFNSNTTKVEKNEQTSDFSIELTDEQLDNFARADYLVFHKRSDGYYEPVYRGRKTVLSGNTLSATVRNRALQITDTEDTGDTFIFPLIETDSGEDYINYYTSVVAESFSNEFVMDTATLYLSYDIPEDKIEISNFVVKDNDELVSSVISNLYDYDNIVFGSMAWKILDADGNIETGDWDRDGVYQGYEISTNALDFQLADFGDGTDYYCTFVIYDVNGNKVYSKLTNMKGTN